MERSLVIHETKFHDFACDIVAMLIDSRQIDNLDEEEFDRMASEIAALFSRQKEVNEESGPTSGYSTEL